jgi:hypothetical protein
MLSLALVLPARADCFSSVGSLTVLLARSQDASQAVVEAIHYSIRFVGADVWHVRA